MSAHVSVAATFRLRYELRSHFFHVCACLCVRVRALCLCLHTVHGTWHMTVFLDHGHNAWVNCKNSTCNWDAKPTGFHGTFFSPCACKVIFQSPGRNTTHVQLTCPQSLTTLTAGPPTCLPGARPGRPESCSPLFTPPVKTIWPVQNPVTPQ